MNNFPLYARVSKGVPEKDLTAKQKKDFVDKTVIMDAEGHDRIYATDESIFLRT